MTKKEFLYDTRKVIYRESVRELNQLLGHSKTGQAAIGMLVNVPLIIELRKVPELPKVTKKFKSLARNVAAYLKHDKGEIVFSFFYTKDSDLKPLLKSIKTNTWYFTYLYFRELLMLSNNYNTYTFYKKTRKKIQKIDPTISPEYYQVIMNTACYIQLTTFIEKIYTIANKQTVFNKLSKYESYDPSIGDKGFNTILNFVITNMKLTTVQNGFSLELNDNQTTLAFNDYPLNDEYEAIITDLGETIETTFKSVSRGTATAEIFKSYFQANDKVKTGWFKKLKKTLSRIVYYQTNDFTSSWGSLNSVYRHKFKSPKHVYTKTGLELVLSIDQSGSMSTEELTKIAGVIKKQGKNITKLHVLIHDTEITNQFTLSASDLNVDSEAFKKALLTRYQSGGTSHYNVYKWMDENIKDKDKLIYISYSDNCSDIPKAYKAFPSLHKAQHVFVCTINNPVNIKGTTDITLE